MFNLGEEDSQRCLPKDDDVCDCECHSDIPVEHPAPCCMSCPFCNRNIKSEFFNDHVAGCEISAAGFEQMISTATWAPE